MSTSFNTQFPKVPSLLLGGAASPSRSDLKRGRNNFLDDGCFPAGVWGRGEGADIIHEHGALDSVFTSCPGMFSLVTMVPNRPGEH